MEEIMYVNELQTFIDELKELKPVVVSLDDNVEDTDTKINKLIKKYEDMMEAFENDFPKYLEMKGIK
jgi:DNA invertase Pin-like site-specific DNA recombinase|tara:strand:- start:153 stop:353 length:201 start_codon:yes stop_codon:yes gene_type:complete